MGLPTSKFTPMKCLNHCAVGNLMLMAVFCHFLLNLLWNTRSYCTIRFGVHIYLCHQKGVSLPQIKMERENMKSVYMQRALTYWQLCMCVLNTAQRSAHSVSTRGKVWNWCQLVPGWRSYSERAIRRKHCCTVRLTDIAYLEWLDAQMAKYGQWKVWSKAHL